MTVTCSKFYKWNIILIPVSNRREKKADLSDIEKSKIVQ